MLRCTSCNREVNAGEYVSFKCPQCGETIIRCDHCRATSTPWKCPKCGFEGP